MGFSIQLNVLSLLRNCPNPESLFLNVDESSPLEKAATGRQLS
jgi:hypothetical protein